MLQRNDIIATAKDLKTVTVIDTGETFVNISKKLENCIVEYQKTDMIPYTGPDIWVRTTVAEMLEKISKKLIAEFPTYSLKIVYGYRHPDIQEQYYTERRKILQKENTNLSKEEIDELTHTMVAVPEVAGHPTGGAVDITLSSFGQDIDMGTRISDFSNPEKIKTFATSLSEEQENNRRLLHDLMTEVGFAPFYGEWWHFSYGDREWAWFYKKHSALYAPLDFRINKES